MLNRVKKMAEPVVAVVKPVLLRRDGLGHNTFHIKEHYDDLQIVMPDAIPVDVTHVIRWGTTSNLPRKGITIINTAKAIHETADKRTFRKRLTEAKLGPRTWLSFDECMDDETPIRHGAIVRPEAHERSEELYHVNDDVELEAAIKKINGPYYISEYIPKDRELRVVVAQGRAMIVSDKIPRDRKAITWGMSKFEYVPWGEWPLATVKTAIDAFNLSTLDFGAVDVIVKGNKTYVLEINTAPEVWGYYGRCFAKVFRHMVENGKDRIPYKAADNWRDLIHPAISKDAR